VIDFAWAPDGKQLAIRASERASVDHTMMYSSLYTLALDGTAPKLLTQTAGKLGDLVWSPTGEQIAFLGAADIHDSTAGIVYTVPATGGDAKPLTASLEATGTRIEWISNTIILLAEQ